MFAEYIWNNISNSMNNRIEILSILSITLKLNLYFINKLIHERESSLRDIFLILIKTNIYTYIYRFSCKKKERKKFRFNNKLH